MSPPSLTFDFNLILIHSESEMSDIDGVICAPSQKFGGARAPSFTRPCWLVINSEMSDTSSLFIRFHTFVVID